MLPIRAVLFDYGLVLSGPPDPMAHRRMESILHTTHADLQNVYWRHRENYDLGVLTGITFWRTVSNELNRPPGSGELNQLLQADLDLWTQPNQPMIDWAIALQNAGISTGILSNMGDAMEAGITDRFPWILGFPHRTFSHRIGVVKPDPRIYRHAIAELGVPAESVLFVDDRIENIEAALAVGLHAIQYSSHENFLHELRRTGITELPLPTAATASRTS